MSQAPESPSADGRPAPNRLAIVLILLGSAFVLWGVLRLSSAGYGETRRDFSQRRPYNQVKRDVHSAFPGALLRAGVGATLIFAGVRRAKRRG